jgi:hypothetical protein
MPHSPLIIVLSATLFFGLFQGTKVFRPPTPSPLVRILPGLPTNKSPGAILWKALVTGDDRGLSRIDKKTYYRLGLGHLFTPSGVHLATLQPLLRHFRNLTGFFALVGLLSTFLPGLQALARVAWVKLVPGGAKQLSVFMSVMLLEGALVSWKLHPLSWTCSWLFLGLSWFTPSRWRLLWFLLAQMLLCWVLQQPFSLFAPLANLIATLPLMLLFPLTLLFAVIPYFFIHTWIESALTIFHQSVLWFDQVHQFIPALSPHAGHLLLLMAWLMLRGRQRWSLALMLLSLSSPLQTFKKSSPSLSQWEAVPSMFESERLSCRNRWREDRWEENCRPTRTVRRQRIKTKKLSYLR